MSSDRRSTSHLNRHKSSALAGKKMEESSDDLEAKKKKFYEHIQDAKLKIKEGLYNEALASYKKAESIHSSEKLQHKITKLTKFLEELELDDSDSEDVGNHYENVDGFKIYKECWDKLYPYQKDGVRWFWNLYTEKKGGILGDDMGLGKTIQVIAFMSGMFDQGLVKYALIVVPKSLLTNWINEFGKWSPGIRLAEFHGTKAKREKELDKIQRKSGVILTTYGTLSTSHEQLAEFHNQRFIWDYIILDEGHKIKNPNKTSKCVRSIPVKNRIILTGTPIQNNLSELWSLMDFVTDGRLLGTLKTFKTEFENPIVRARERDASTYEKRVGDEISETLRQMIAKHILRRRKADVFKAQDESTEVDGVEDSTSNDSSKESVSKMDVKLSKKNDLIVWLYLSDIQLKIYKQFLQLDYIVEAMHSTRSPLAQLTMLKKISDHPRLGECEDILVEESSKLQFVLELVNSFVKEGHRALIFSQSRKMLDIVDKVLSKQGVKLLRFDGRILDPAERQSLIEKYQNDTSYTCFLLTTQVGAVGLNLTAADRVIIFDPSWNPGNDAQAVDRAYRIGQNKDVIIYRLITCGTIEEKIYRKQIFKDALSKQTTGTCKNPLRYFARHQLRELFILGDTTFSETHGILRELSGEMKWDPSVESHLGFLKSLNIFGVSNHSSVYAKEERNVEEEVNVRGMEFDMQVVERAKRAQDLVMSEVNLCDRISHLSINESFKPTDIRRYLPTLSKDEKKKQRKRSSGTEVVSVVVPDSPTASHNFGSPDGEQPRNHVGNVIEIEDSFTEGSESPQKSDNNSSDHLVEDSPTGTSEGSGEDEKTGVISPVELLPLNGSSHDHIGISPVKKEIFIEDSDEERPANVLVSKQHSPERGTDSNCCSSANYSVQDSFDDKTCPAVSQMRSISTNEYLPNGDLQASTGEDSLSHDEKESLCSKNSVNVDASSASYVDMVDDMCSPISNVSLHQEPISTSLNAAVDKSVFTPDSVMPITNAVAASSTVASTPKSAIARDSFSAVKDSPRKDLRRSAAALIYGLTKTYDNTANSPTEVSVEVVDMACSPLRVEENENNFLKEPANGSSVNLQTLSANSSAYGNDQRVSFGLHEVVRHYDINAQQCSTPHQEKPVPPIDVNVDRRRTFNWSAMANLQITEKSLESDGFSNDAESESMFSNSANKLENQSQPASTDLGNSATGMCTSSQYATSQSLFSELTADGSKDKSAQNSQRRSKSMQGEMADLPENPYDDDIQEAETILITPRDNDNSMPDLSMGEYTSDRNTIRTGNFPNGSSHSGKDAKSLNGSYRHNDESNESCEFTVKGETSTSLANQTNGDDLSSNEETGDYDDCNDDDSVSSNELQMISLLSGNRSINREQAISDHEYPDDFDSESDSSDSDDEVLLHSRRSLRKSILGKGTSLIASDHSPMAVKESPILHHSDGSIDSQSEERASINEEPVQADQSQGSYLSEQEVATQPCNQDAATPPLYVWDKPFYRRCPGNTSKNCLLDEGEGSQSAGNVLEVSRQSITDEVSAQESTEPCPCRRHVPSDVKIRRCFCVLSSQERVEYMNHVKEAKRQEHLGNETNALLAFLKALDIADHDLMMQRTACLLLKKLQL
eukprot:gene15254-6462_t